ncbi:hypothetical protein DB346_11530 [Verrucomicrobia bacterium LW23]|nr:hypothetical protein DB346_11530 [Verrucomicrobia bacterium LW23]
MRSLVLLGIFLCMVAGGACLAVVLSPHIRPTLKALARDSSAGDKTKPDDAAAPSGLPIHPTFNGLEGKLLRLTQGPDQFYPAKVGDTQVKYVFVYFSAEWCWACKEVTPSLVSFYDKYRSQAKARGVPFEIIFISSDNSSKAMREYAQGAKMNWLVMRHNVGRTTANPLHRLSGRYIPCLVLLGPDGQVIAGGDGQEKARAAMSEMIRIVNRS